ncbi:MULTISPECIES: hypothetical protein [unclassified Moraxella]|uniref:hypothetical protein n=1 Tax=unclassified Moraxella TaxID=2685852 RepID=UPI003AF568E2
MLKFWIGLNGVISLFFWWVFYVRYWQYRDLFNENGRYFDGEQVLTEGGMFWSIFAMLFLIITLILLYFYHKKSRN